jgi:hypothetical protein
MVASGATPCYPNPRQLWPVESTGSWPNMLRHRSNSVILGLFVNEGFDETVTLAQVFHQPTPPHARGASPPKSPRCGT